jgi:hypothetical protein
MGSLLSALYGFVDAWGAERCRVLMVGLDAAGEPAL